MEQNASTLHAEPPAPPAPPAPQRTTKRQTGNVFSKHKIWFLVLLVVCLFFCAAFPSKTISSEILWASVIGRVAGMFIGAFLLAGFVWLVSLLTRSGTTSVQFMCVFTVAISLFIASQVFLFVYDKKSGSVSQLSTQQAIKKPDVSELNEPNGVLASGVVQEPVLAERTEAGTTDEESWQAREFDEDMKWRAVANDVLLKTAEAGNAAAQVALGQRCMPDWFKNDTNSAEREHVAALWFQRAASRGSARALFELAICYRNGIGVKQDDAEDGKFLRKAADSGYAGAQFAIAVQYRVDKNPKEAFKWYVRAANQNHSGAMLAVGEMCEQGEGVAQDRAKAANCYAKAANTDGGMRAEARHARFCLDMLSNQGFGILANRQEAVRIYRQAAEAGDAKAEYFLGRILEYGYGLTSDYNEAKAWNRKAAEGGYGMAQLLLGESGVLGAETKAERRQWLLKAAGQGVGEAYKPLLSSGGNESGGNDFSVEIGFGKFRVQRFSLDRDRDAGLYAYKQKDWTNAFRFFLKAAKDGNLDAQYALSVMYSLGQGVEANQTKADECLAMVAMLPSDAALTDLGLKNLKSTNSWKSSVMAPQELALAAVMGNDSAIEELRKHWDEGLGWLGLVEQERVQRYLETTDMRSLDMTPQELVLAAGLMDHSQERVHHSPTNVQQELEQFEEDRISPLKGIQAFRILVNSPGKDAEDDGLTKDDLQTAVELRLRSAGIKIARDWRAPWLRVNVTCFKGEKDSLTYAVHMSVSVEAVAIYKFQSVTVPIWSTDNVGVCGTRRISTVKEWVSGLLDRFANDYLKANPKQ